LCIKLPTLQHLFIHNPSSALTFPKLKLLLVPEFSEVGSNKRRFEGEVYAVFIKYLHELASNRIDHVTLEDVLSFATGSVQEPVLGFGTHPSIEFVEYKESFQPE
ncbi:uncharacterized protein LOC144350715, partial [Saccoglossus kowalevskii]